MKKQKQKREAVRPFKDYEEFKESGFNLGIIVKRKGEPYYSILDSINFGEKEPYDSNSPSFWFANYELISPINNSYSIGKTIIIEEEVILEEKEEQETDEEYEYRVNQKPMHFNEAEESTKRRNKKMKRQKTSSSYEIGDKFQVKSQEDIINYLEKNNFKECSNGNWRKFEQPTWWSYLFNDACNKTFTLESISLSGYLFSEGILFLEEWVDKVESKS